jgi:hypothetical protein
MKTDGQDPADSIRASYTPDMAETIDTLEDQMRERLAQMQAMNPTLGLDRSEEHTSELQSLRLLR